MNFSELGLRPALLRRCESLGYTEPTPIQERAIPVVLTGADLIGCAETGTGKTAAFLLPTLQRMAETKRPGVRVLVLAPTRELVSQIHESYKQLAPKGSPRCAAVIGGASPILCIVGRRKAAVLPVPVSAQPMRSAPVSTTGIARSWMVVGFS